MEVGWTTFGENRVQDMVVKAAEFPGASWEMIGHLQRNKAQLACSVMTKLHSLDSLELAEKLESILALNQPQRLLDVLVEVNTSEESTKHGIPGDQVLDFAAQLRRSPHLRPCGLMTVAHPDPRRAEAGFRLLASLRHQLMERDHGGWEELSMGMSSDLELAIAHGSTCVRLGTAIFGSRHP
jgi:pyridoxal phosphate enzyme (YggS family)